MGTDKINIALSCEVCKHHNYHFGRGTKKDFKLELKKFCKNCGKSTKHKEIKA